MLLVKQLEYKWNLYVIETTQSCFLLSGLVPRYCITFSSFSLHWSIVSYSPGWTCYTCMHISLNKIDITDVSRQIYVCYYVLLHIIVLLYATYIIPECLYHKQVSDCCNRSPWRKGRWFDTAIQKCFDIPEPVKQYLDTCIACTYHLPLM